MNCRTLGAIVGPGAMQLAVVVAVSRHARGIDDRPVGHIGEEPVGIVFEKFRLDERRSQPHALGISPRAVSFLDGIAAAKRRPAAAVDELAAHVEILLDDEDGSPEIARPYRGVQAHAPRAKHNDIGFIIPDNALRARQALRQRVASPRQNSRAACGGAALEEVSPAQRFWLLKLWLFASCVTLLGHLGSSPEICCLPFMQ